MSIARFAAYAAAFEKAVETDDWSLVEPFFHEEAVYEVPIGPPLGGRFEGRAAILAYFKRVLDDFDRRFASRTVELLEGPVEKGNEVWVKGVARYTADGLPGLAFELEETVRFDGDRIVHLADAYDAETERAVREYLAAHGERLGIPPL